MSEKLDLAFKVIHMALKKRVAIATAESLTGGLLAGELVSIPGASDVFTGGIVAYHTYLKHQLLGVSSEWLEEHGPINATTARQMALGVAQKLVPERDFELQGILGVSTTGVAGPDPQAGHPVGEVWVGTSFLGETHAHEYKFAGSREEIRALAVQEALKAAINKLESI